ncbi:ABC transporter ATP-binding protein [Alloyangia pacifica]|uniref:sn-glycerol 3-phosphate transport system ATP-binding protein n=1 Tax=Alloyangia pacifica TaxID=311180 RepID=A0A1I6UQ34_9RHOB|nr:sn-glycerol-3-phosphate ABC transporter ATP-binding protein UgpC [Alloyangia pacifica]SDH77600.1 sn-glycerol 3-phosphate transport system ATP-binding protein [Alloyangia pacifica]SFT03407.1 sn-glycerol 3-phosphate transport system ATP-binding protein [Alloyangia pacifica]
MLETSSTAAIGLHGLVKSYGETPVIPGLDAELRGGEFTVILGPSGCGKSTLLNCIAGLERLSAGRITIGGREVQEEEPKNRRLAMVFQNYALYPHMTVAENIGYALKVAGVNKTERAARVAEAARVVELGDYLDRRPGQLSGGQRQRVAIARAVVREPQVLLYDEPLSNLDAKLRHDMRRELAELHRRIGATSVFVTHDQVEAMTLADRIMVLNKGRIEQFDTPEAIYHRPASTFVAGFIGSPAMNLVDVTGEGGVLRLADGTALAAHSHRGPAILGIRPELVVPAPDGLPVQITYREELGAHAVLTLRLPDGTALRMATALGQRGGLPTDLRVALPAAELHLFDPLTGKALASATPATQTKKAQHDHVPS